MVNNIKLNCAQPTNIQNELCCFAHYLLDQENRLLAMSQRFAVQTRGSLSYRSTICLVTLPRVVKLWDQLNERVSRGKIFTMTW